MNIHYRKLSLLASTLLAASLLFTGCDDDDDDDLLTAVGYFFNLNAPVEGLSFLCGQATGVTNTLGKFLFEPNKACTFRIGNLPFKNVPAEELTDGVKIVERNLESVKLLQSLDYDANPDNGIQLDEKVIEAFNRALAKYEVNGLPDEATLEAIVADIKAEVPDFAGSVPSEEAFNAYVNQFLTETSKAQLAGKTFYVVGQDAEDAADIWAGQVTFDADASRITYTDGNGQKSMKMEINGNTVGWEDGTYSVLVRVTDDYVEFADYFSDGTLDSHTRLYFDRTKAMEYYNTLMNQSNVSPFTTDYLDGKSLYFVQYTNFGQAVLPKKWYLVRMDFTKNEISWTPYDLPLGTYTLDYHIENGEIVVEDARVGTISPEEVTAEYIKVCQGGDCDTYLFFDEEKAKTFRDAKNGG
ncbi:hypothetical protein [Hydrogenimonas sp.]